MLPIVAVLLAALCFSTTGTAQAFSGVDASALSVGASRLLVGGTVLGLVALRDVRSGTAQANRTPAPPHGLPTWTVIALGVLGALAYQPFFFAGTRLNGVAVGTVITLGSSPVSTGLLDALIRRRLPSPRWVVATAIALAGVLLVSGMIGSGQGGIALAPGGVLASVGAGAAYALLTVSSKLLLDRSWGPTLAMGTIFGAAALLSIPVLLATPTEWLATPSGVALALWLGLVTTATAYLLFGWGLQRLAPTTVATLSLAEPLGATLLGVVVLHEHLSATALVGIAVIVVGLVLLARPARTAAAAVSATS
ncbi:MAG: DMT family transporter [Pauljensenia sp.]